jgi:hypothetical protein
MKQVHLFLVTLIVSSLFGCSEQITVEEIKRFAPTETYPNDFF